MKIILLIALLVTTSTFAQNFYPHDISIMFPMPKMIPDRDAVMATEIIPAPSLKILPALDPKLSQSTQHKYLQITAVRIDPPELRLVWQIFAPIGGRVEALDSSVHTFHQIADVPAFLKELKRISALSRNEVSLMTPLSVHPTLERQGMNGSYGKELMKFLRKEATQRNMFKITWMALKIAETEWDFAGFDIKGSQHVPVNIPRVSYAGTQIFINQSFHEFSGGFGPAPQGQDEFNRLIHDSYKAQVKEPANLKKALTQALRIENPRLENVNTMDCVSCHLAQTARTWIETAEPTLTKEVENKFTSKKYLLTNTTSDPSRTDNVHAFSYFFDMATINQRTINETAFTLEKLNR